MNRLNTKIRLTILCLSGSELYSRWVPLTNETTSDLQPNVLLCAGAETKTKNNSCHLFCK